MRRVFPPWPEGVDNRSVDIWQLDVEEWERDRPLEGEGEEAGVREEVEDEMARRVLFGPPRCRGWVRRMEQKEGVDKRANMCAAEGSC